LGGEKNNSHSTIHTQFGVRNVSLVNTRPSSR
jgi:hypothetical protein